MKLGIKLAEAKKTYIDKNNCAICINGLPINTGRVIKCQFVPKVKFICKKSLKFPYCRYQEKGFRLK